MVNVVGWHRVKVNRGYPWTGRGGTTFARKQEVRTPRLYFWSVKVFFTDLAQNLDYHGRTVIR